MDSTSKPAPAVDMRARDSILIALMKAGVAGAAGASLEVQLMQEYHELLASGESRSRALGTVLGRVPDRAAPFRTREPQSDTPVTEQHPQSRFRALAAPLLLIGLLALGAWKYFSSQNAGKLEEARQAAGKEARAEEVAGRITRFASEHNAVSDWRKELSKRTVVDTVYSAELHAALVRQDGRPSLFVGSVENVGLDRDKFTASLRGMVNFQTLFRLQLSCTPAQAEVFLSAPRSAKDRFAVVALIHSVAATKREGTPPSDDAVSEMTGTLVDALFLGTSYEREDKDTFAPFREPR